MAQSGHDHTQGRTSASCHKRKLPRAPRASISRVLTDAREMLMLASVSLVLDMCVSSGAGCTGVSRPVGFP
jgi:hypothetical protein